MQFVVYILYSAVLDKFYIGHTGDDINERLRKHLSNHSGYTSKAKDWTIVYQELAEDKAAACKREFAIKKKKSKAFIRQLIAGSDHPDL